jgi:hypothetical protein
MTTPTHSARASVTREAGERDDGGYGAAVGASSSQSIQPGGKDRRAAASVAPSSLPLGQERFDEARPGTIPTRQSDHPPHKIPEPTRYLRPVIGMRSKKH